MNFEAKTYKRIGRWWEVLLKKVHGDKDNL